MSNKPQAVSLKEWAAAIEALRLGKQIMIMRKGGIREETKDFQIESDCFYLYPTYEHQKKHLIKPEYQVQVDESVADWETHKHEAFIRCYAELVQDILISSEEELDKLIEFHIWTERFVEERLRWKRDKPLHLMLLRIYELENPIRIPILEEYSGCKSWIGLPAEMLAAVSRKPVLPDHEFSEAVDKIKLALKQR